MRTTGAWGALPRSPTGPHTPCICLCSVLLLYLYIARAVLLVYDCWSRGVGCVGAVFCRTRLSLFPRPPVRRTGVSVSPNTHLLCIVSRLPLHQLLGCPCASYCPCSHPPKWSLQVMGPQSPSVQPLCHPSPPTWVLTQPLSPLSALATVLQLPPYILRLALADP